MLSGNEAEVNSVDEGPLLPAALASTEKVSGDLGLNRAKGVASDEAEVGEEHGHDDGAPEELVNRHLGRDGRRRSSLDTVVEPPLEVVAGGGMVEEAGGGG